MSKIEIKNVSSRVIVSGDYSSIKECVEQNKNQLQGANLQGAYLRDAYLHEANIHDAYLQGAYLQSAYLRDANLQGAYLRDANLQDTKGYLLSHDFFKELIRQQKSSVFTEIEWAVIGQIIIYELCWGVIKTRFPNKIAHIFELLAAKGFTEWLEYWNTCSHSKGEGK